jgi:hypothetical protein
LAVENKKKKEDLTTEKTEKTEKIIGKLTTEGNGKKRKEENGRRKGKRIFLTWIKKMKRILMFAEFHDDKGFF